VKHGIELNVSHESYSTMRGKILQKA